MYAWPTPAARPGKRRPLAVAAGAALAIVLAVATAAYIHGPEARPATSTGSVTIFGPKAASLDPAVQSDAGSAEVVAQLFESLTAIDAAGHVQPALADRWQA